MMMTPRLTPGPTFRSVGRTHTLLDLAPTSPLKLESKPLHAGATGLKESTTHRWLCLCALRQNRQRVNARIKARWEPHWNRVNPSPLKSRRNDIDSS